MHVLVSILFLFLPLADVEVAVTTTGGDVLRGTVSVRSFEIETDFGSARVDAEQLARIDLGADGADDLILTRGDVQLRGRVELRSLKVKTDEGTRTVRRAELASIAAVIGGRAFGAADFSGRWSTSYGPMTLTQEGLEVSGTYGFTDTSSLEGRLEEGRLVFEYRGAGGRGEGAVELWEDGETFTGRYTHSNGNEDFWGGYRIEPRLAEARPGEVTRGQTTSFLNYHLRVPADYDPERRYPALAFFHGSNMSSAPYVDTIASTWPELAEDYVIVGFDGEKLSSASSPGDRRFNASYINFSGHEVGEPWRYRQTPGLVADALEELAGALPIDGWFVGGHSQGGFLTYAIAMFYPRLVRGAFPMSCNLLVQCEPSYFDDEEQKALQRAVAFAPIHGRADDVVGFSGGEYCYEALQDGGFPMLHFFASGGGHSFMHLPVEEAVRWLESMTAEDPGALAVFAEERLETEEPRDALAAALRAQEQGASGEAARRAREVIERVDAELADDARELAKEIERNRDASWVDDFWEFRRKYAFAPGARGVMEAYAALREEHQGPAEKLFREARGEGDDDARKRKYMRIVEEYWASRYYRMIRRWYE